MIKNEADRKLLQAFLDAESAQYPEVYQKKLKLREEKVISIIERFGKNKVSITTHTNMMQRLHTLTLDVYETKGWQEGNIIIDLGSEAHEIWVRRLPIKSSEELFDFNKDAWVKEVGN